MFLDEFSSLLAILTVSSSHLLLTGDFNIHVDVADDREAVSFLNILDLHDLKQHVDGPTHTGKHTLDLLISRRYNNFVSSLSIQGGLPSDHLAIKCLINISRPVPSSKCVKTRRIRNIKNYVFCSDIQSSFLPVPLDADSDSLVSDYNNILSKILDDHAPTVNRTVVLRPHAPWYSDALRAEKKERRRQCEKYNTLLAKAKADYHSSQIAECDQRDLFRVISKLSSSKATQSLPAHDCPEDLADSFAEFFHNKIKKLDGLHVSTTPSLSVKINESCTSTFSNFSEVSEDDVLNAIKSASINPNSLSIVTEQ